MEEDEVKSKSICKLSLTPDGEGLIIECGSTEIIARPSLFKLKGTRESNNYFFSSPDTERQREALDKIFHTEPTDSMKEKLKKWFSEWTL